MDQGEKPDENGTYVSHRESSMPKPGSQPILNMADFTDDPDEAIAEAERRSLLPEYMGDTATASLDAHISSTDDERRLGPASGTAESRTEHNKPASAKKSWSLKDDPFQKVDSNKRARSSSPGATSKRLRKDEDSASTAPTATISPAEAPSTQKSPVNFLNSKDPVFPDGVVKKTWVYGHPRDDDIKIEEVIQPRILKVAALSSWQWDAHWLLSKINTRTTSVTLIMDENTAEAPSIHQAYPYISIVGPQNVGGIMHAKIMLLFYETYSRIVVSTANLVPYDWGEYGKMENSVFLIDLPFLPQPTSRAPTSRNELEAIISESGPYTRFFEGLWNFCRYVNLKPANKAMKLLGTCDFTSTAQYAFIYSVGTADKGSEGSPNAAYWGLDGLATQVERLGLHCNGRLQIDYITSSVGFLDNTFLTRLYRACQGRSQSLYPMEPSTLRSDIRVYYPSHLTILNSDSNKSPPESIFIAPTAWKQVQPLSVLYDCRSTREGVLMHNKVRGLKQGVVYHGSLTAAAFVRSTSRSSPEA